jgi:hypothetical protein
MSQVHSYEDLYDQMIVPMLLKMNVEQYCYFSLGVSLVMLTVSRSIFEGRDLLGTMSELEEETVRPDREALATRMLMLGAFLDKVKERLTR